MNRESDKAYNHYINTAKHISVQDAFYAGYIAGYNNAERLEKRPIKSLIITQSKEQPYIFKVLGDQEYTVNLMEMNCTCPDYLHRKHKEGQFCKHILEVIKRVTE